jgi:hypothetical protein
MKQLLLLLMLATAFCGCQTSTERRAVQVLATVTRAADGALDAYAAASVLGKTDPETDRKVAAINDRYLIAKNALRHAIIAYKAGRTGPQPVREASAALEFVTAEITAIHIP